MAVSVVDFGAVGDNVTDDHAAFVAAIAAAGTGVVHVPAGTYRLSREILITGPVPTIIGEGLASTCAFVTGGFRRPDQGGSAGGWQLGGFERLRITTGDDAWSIDVEDTVCGLHFRDLLTSGRNGIKISHCFDWKATNITCRGTESAGIGFLADNHGALTGYNAAGMDVGLVVDGMGISVAEARIEQCNTGISIGTGDIGTLIASTIMAVTVESCAVGIYVHSMQACDITGVQVLGYQLGGPKSQFGLRGIEIRAATRSAIRNARVVGSYQRGAVSCGAVDGASLTMENVSAENNLGPAWDLRGGLPAIRGCANIGDYAPRSWWRTGEVAVAAGQTEVFAPFPLTASESRMVISSVTGIAGGLPAGEYEYCLAAVDHAGPYGDMPRWQKSFMITDGGARIALVSPGGNETISRRLYRRPLGGEWWGWFDLPYPTSVFEDTGQPFDGAGGVPVAGAVRKSFCGQDAGFSVAAAPDFEALVWVAERRQDGILFGLASGHGGGVIRWSLTR